MTDAFGKAAVSLPKPATGFVHEVGWIAGAGTGDAIATVFLLGKCTTLYGISNGFGTQADNQIYQIDPATGTISNAHQVTLAGFTVGSSQAMAARPGDGVLFGVIQTTEPARRLVTIDPNTGVATSIGVLTNQISSLAFRNTGTLWAVSGDGGSPAETLYTVNTSNAALTLQFALGNGADGETIAFHGNGLMYHSSGNASAEFESVNVDTQVVTPIGTAVGEMFAMGYNPTNGQLYGSDIASDLFTIDIATGARTPIGFINGPNDNRGLAFVSSCLPKSDSNADRNGHVHTYTHGYG